MFATVACESEGGSGDAQAAQRSGDKMGTVLLLLWYLSKVALYRVR